MRKWTQNWRGTGSTNAAKVMDDASASRLGCRSPPRNPASDQDVLQRDIDAVLDLKIDREFVVIRLTVLIQVFDDSDTVNDVVGDDKADWPRCSR